MMVLEGEERGGRSLCWRDLVNAALRKNEEKEKKKEGGEKTKLRQNQFQDRKELKEMRREGERR